MDAISHAVEIVGSQTQLAAVLGLTVPTVNQWVNGGRPVPVGRVPAIERATCGKVTAEKLFPSARWIRVPDPNWPHPAGRPCVDLAGQGRAAA